MSSSSSSSSGSDEDDHSTNNNGDIVPIVPAVAAPPAVAVAAATTNQKKAPVYVSIGDDAFKTKTVIVFHIDLEHAGDDAGVVQISVVVHDPSTNSKLGEFNKFIRPPTNKFWSAEACSVHGLSKRDPRIMMASPLEVVWLQFTSFIEGCLDRGNKIGVIAAWGGKSCDCEWLFRITEDIHRGSLHMPRWCLYFMDPSGIIKDYTSCRLNQRHSNVIGYGLEEMYCYVTGNEELQGAHDSLQDALAQYTICSDERFLPFMNKNKSLIKEEVKICC